MNTIGQRIKALRIRQGLSLQQLARLVDKSKGNISGYENDKFEPSAQTIISLSSYFNVSTDWLLKGEELTKLQPIEKELFLLYRELDDQGRQEVNNFIKTKRSTNSKDCEIFPAY